MPRRAAVTALSCSVRLRLAADSSTRASALAAALAAAPFAAAALAAARAAAALAADLAAAPLAAALAAALVAAALSAGARATAPSPPPPQPTCAPRRATSPLTPRARSPTWACTSSPGRGQLWPRPPPRRGWQHRADPRPRHRREPKLGRRERSTGSHTANVYGV